VHGAVHGPMPLFMPAEAGFEDCALIFFEFLQVKNQASRLNMQIKLSYQYFDYEGHNP